MHSQRLRQLLKENPSYYTNPANDEEIEGPDVRLGASKSAAPQKAPSSSIKESLPDVKPLVPIKNDSFHGKSAQITSSTLRKPVEDPVDQQVRALRDAIEGVRLSGGVPAPVQRPLAAATSDVAQEKSNEVSAKSTAETLSSSKAQEGVPTNPSKNVSRPKQTKGDHKQNDKTSHAVPRDERKKEEEKTKTKENQKPQPQRNEANNGSVAVPTAAQRLAAANSKQQAELTKVSRKVEQVEKHVTPASSSKINTPAQVPQKKIEKETMTSTSVSRPTNAGPVLSSLRSLLQSEESRAKVLNEVMLVNQHVVASSVEDSETAKKSQTTISKVIGCPTEQLTPAYQKAEAERRRTERAKLQAMEDEEQEKARADYLARVTAIAEEEEARRVELKAKMDALASEKLVRELSGENANEKASWNRLGDKKDRQRMKAQVREALSAQEGVKSQGREAPRRRHNTSAPAPKSRFSAIFSDDDE